jgi:hypothetical protein
MDLEISEVIVKRIRDINFFHNCGNILNFEPAMSIKYVESWKEAKKNYTDPNWENITLEARNNLTSFLSLNFTKEYQEWNNYSSFLRKEILPDLLQVLNPIEQENSLGDKFIKTVTWTILNSIMEYVYKDYSKEHTFFLTLLEIYEAGYFPCGWIGTWPEGSLVVY